jgi:two-component system CAI-1 autoinducer sensor kinase/phosphatase CqsS
MSNHASSVWLMSTTAVMFWMILLFDFFGFVLSSFLGCTAAVLLFMALNDGFHWDSKYDGYVYQYIGNFLVGLLFAKNKDKYEKMKLNGARELGGHVAHELRTPLTTIEIGSRSLKDYLPKLFSIYEKAKLAGLDVEGIESRHYKIIKTLLNGIETSSLYSNLTIDAILKNMYRSNNKEEFKKHSILECYKAAYERYPFKGNEKSFFGKIEIIDFSFNGSDILMSHIFFNLIKNAIYFIHSEKRGNISAWTKIEKNKNTLFFQDTSRGIKKDEMCHIFEKFYSTTKIGTGLGLAFCRKTMISFGGDIKCYSEYGKFTRFELIFKKEKDDK